MVHVGMSGDQSPALQEREIQLTDHLDDLVHAFGIAYIDQSPISIVVHKVDIAADPPPGLVVHLNHTGKYWAALKHRYF
jgi:hypothetical protein